MGREPRSVGEFVLGRTAEVAEGLERRPLEQVMTYVSYWMLGLWGIRWIIERNNGTQA
ncbi:MAG: hypothetical protein P1P76_04775 [Anaerolineales bacterium]|nr:hypothetical protein [Anaerolineales bacterium]